MVFIADDFAAWLVGLLADAGHKKLTSLILGSDQERALRSAATAAVRRTADELRPTDAQQADQLAMVISEVFNTLETAVPLADDVTVLEALQASIAGQLAVLDDVDLTSTGQSSADVLEVPAGLLAQELTRHLRREIITRGAGGGPLFPLASQLNDDVTHLQGQRIETVLGQLAGEIGQLSPARARITGRDDEMAVSGTPRPRASISFPAQLIQRTVPLSDGVRSGTLLAIEIQPHRELEQATVVMTGITGPPGVKTIPPPARLYWHPARQVWCAIAKGASNLINIARVGPLPPSAVMDTPDLDLPWSLPNGRYQVGLQFTAKGCPARLATATFNVSSADGFPLQRLEWLMLTVDAVAAEPSVSEPEPPFTPRPYLAERLDETWCTPASNWHWLTSQRVCLIGDAGAGKTRFIREHTASDHPAWIEASADEAMLRGMIDLLDCYDEDTTGLDASLIKRAFGRLLTRPDGPPLIIIDGISDPVTLDQFIPGNTNTRLIITSRKRPPKNWSPIVDVSDLYDDEAISMIAQLLPDISETDCRALAITLGCRPLLIEHGCRYIRNTGAADIQAFCHAVDQDIATAVDAVTDRTQQRLTSIYRLYAERLGQEFPESLKLLQLLAFVGHDHVPPEYVMSYLLNVSHVTLAQLVRGELAYEAAVRPLESYSLIEVTPGFGISIRPLIQGILQLIFANQLKIIVERSLKLFKVTGETLYEQGWYILTVAGRAACNRALIAHVRDKITPDGELHFSGELGGIKWNLLVNRLFHRIAFFEYLYLMIKDKQWEWAKEATTDHELLQDVANRPRIQRQEIAATKIMFERYDGIRANRKANANELSNEQSQDPDPDKLADASVALVKKLYGLAARYEDSPLGPLDFDIVDSYRPDPSQEELDQIRRVFYDLCNKPQEPKERQVEDHSL